VLRTLGRGLAALTLGLLCVLWADTASLAATADPSPPPAEPPSSTPSPEPSSPAPAEPTSSPAPPAAAAAPAAMTAAETGTEVGLTPDRWAQIELAMAIVVFFVVVYVVASFGRRSG
jgi:hypothetical protein